MSIQNKIELFRDLIYQAQNEYDTPFMQMIYFLTSLNKANTAATNYNKYIENEFDPIIYDYLESNLPLLTDPRSDLDGTLFSMLIASSNPLVWTSLKNIEAFYDFIIKNRIPIYSTPEYLFWRPLLTNVDYEPSFLNFTFDLTPKLSGVASDPNRFEAALISEMKKLFPILKPNTMLSTRNSDGALNYSLRFSLPEFVPTLQLHLTIDWFSEETDPEQYLQGAHSTLSWDNTIDRHKMIQSDLAGYVQPARRG